jgi:hypothetical protein
MFVEKYLQIGIVNFKHQLLPHLLLSFVVLLFSPFILGVENLDAVQTAQALEMYVAFLGIILLTPIYYPEQNQDLKDLVNSKYTSLTTVIFIRLLEAFLCLALFVGGFIIFLKNNHCTFPETYFYLGTLAEAVFLGGMGFLAYSIFDQIAIAYMLPMVYYVMAIGGGSKLLKVFYPFSMMYGSYREKVYLCITGGLFLLIGLGIRHMIRKI